MKLPERYNRENITRALRDPSMIRRELNRIYIDPVDLIMSKLHNTVDRRLFDYRYGEGTDVMDKDWDNLLILDACRYDFFEQVNSIQGSLQKCVSEASHSEEFIDENFKGKELYDTVYISANPFTEKIEDGTFYKVVKSYGKEYSQGDALYKNRHPGRMHELTTEVYEDHPNKRFIVHFMQPHSPYLGPTAEKLRSELQKSEHIKFKNWEEDPDWDGDWVDELLDAMEQGYISRSQMIDAYIENLEMVLEYAEKTAALLGGKTVVTSDHGEMFGQPQGLFLPQKFQHRRNCYCPELRIVPWLEIDADERRDVRRESPISMTDVDQEVIDEHLSALGYI